MCTVTSVKLAAVAEGLSAGSRLGDALGRAESGQATPTGDLPMKPRRIINNGQTVRRATAVGGNNSVRQVYSGRCSLRSVYGGVLSVSAPVGVRRDGVRQCTAGLSGGTTGVRQCTAGLSVVLGTTVYGSVRQVCRCSNGVQQVYSR